MLYVDDAPAIYCFAIIFTGFQKKTAKLNIMIHDMLQFYL